MANSTGAHVNISSYAKEEHDGVEYRKRVQMFADGNSVSYEDTNFVTGDSPAVLAVNTDLGRLGHGGYVVNDGPGDIQIEISNDGTNYGGTHTLRFGDVLDLENATIHKIRLTWIHNTAYRAFVI